MHARSLNAQGGLKPVSARTHAPTELAPKSFGGPRTGLENVLPNTKESARSLANQAAMAESLLPRPLLAKQSSLGLKNPKDLFKKLTSNKNSGNALKNRRSQERDSENSLKHPQNVRPPSREKLPANPRVQLSKPLQVKTQLLSLGLAPKGLVARQVALKQVVKPAQIQHCVSSLNVTHLQNNQSVSHPHTSMSTSQNVSHLNPTYHSNDRQPAQVSRNPTTFKELMRRERSKEQTTFGGIKVQRLKTENDSLQTGTTFATEKQLQPQTTTNAQRVRDESFSRRVRHVRQQNIASNVEAPAFQNHHMVMEDAYQPNILKCNELITNIPAVRPLVQRGIALNIDEIARKRSLNAFESNRESCSLDRLEIVQAPPSIVFEQEQLSNHFDPATIAHLIAEESDYAANPHYLSQNQGQIKWQMRSILLDWVQEVCSDYLFKRETFHFAVNYIDRYLCARGDVDKGNLQLVGLTALFLAAKMEEVYTPKAENMLSAANNTYNVYQLLAYEHKMLGALNFKTTPPTLNLWANWYMTQWDNFAEDSDFARRHMLARQRPLPRFRQPTEHAYALFRELMQLLDAAVLEVQSLQHKPRAIVAAFMYVLLGKELGQFPREKIVEEFPCSSLYLLDESFAFNDLFGRFLSECFALCLLDLLPTIQFAATFFGLPVVINLPVAAKVDKENVLQGHFEEFLAYQTHNNEALKFVLQFRNRNFF